MIDLLPAASRVSSQVLVHTELSPDVAPGISGGWELVIEEPPVIERILDQIGEWGPSPPPRAPPAEQEWPKGCQIPLSCHPVPDMTGFRGPLMVQSLTSAKSKFLSLAG